MTLKFSGEQLRKEMERRCRDAYIRERSDYEMRLHGQSHYSPGPKWDGGRDSQGHQQPSVWPKMADFMLKHDLDPRLCIYVRFRRRSNHSNPVLPNQIALDKYLRFYQEVSAEMKDEISRSFSAEKGICFAQFSLYEGVEAKEAQTDILLDETINLSPLFRHCLAVSCKLPKVAEHYLHAALLQYSLATAEYDEVWGEWIYEKFRETAQAAKAAAARRKRSDGKH